MSDNVDFFELVREYKDKLETNIVLVRAVRAFGDGKEDRELPFYRVLQLTTDGESLYALVKLRECSREFSNYAVAVNATKTGLYDVTENRMLYENPDASLKDVVKYSRIGN